MHRSIITSLILALGLAGMAPAGPVLAAGHIHAVTVTGYPAAMAGGGWNAGALLGVVVRSGQYAAGLELRTTVRGSFKVAVTGGDPCSAWRFDVYRQDGQHAALQIAAPGCASSGAGTALQVVLVKGQAVKEKPPAFFGLQSLPVAGVRLRVGQTLYWWEAGGLRPAVVPGVNPAYLALVAKGKTPARACSLPTCSAGYYWQWVAVQPGVTGIDLEPICRRMKPQCELPDRLIRVIIAP